MHNILIVDDEPVIRKFLFHYLSRIGTCDQALNGQEAVTMARKAMEDDKPYDLVIMDIMMPEMDGLEAVRSIVDMQEERGVPEAKRTKILMLSCLGDPENVIRAQFESGADGYLTKPLETRNLTEALVNLGLVKENDSGSAHR